MALELVVVEGLVVLILASMGFAYFSGLKIFWMISFLLLMFTGFFMFTAGGIITNHYYDVNGVYSSTILPVTSGVGYIFSMLCLWCGLILVVWTSIIAALLDATKASSKPFVWD